MKIKSFPLDHLSCFQFKGAGSFPILTVLPYLYIHTLLRFQNLAVIPNF